MPQKKSKVSNALIPNKVLESAIMVFLTTLLTTRSKFRSEIGNPATDEGTHSEDGELTKVSSVREIRIHGFIESPRE